MEKLTLKRFAYTPMGTFGRIELGSGKTIYTVEDAWRENAQNVSCIPLGTYQCSPRFYNRGGYPAIHIENVPGRSHILIHRGNTELDVQGCVVTGMQLGFIANRWAVSDSRTAFELLTDEYGEKEFNLEIISFDPASESYLTARTADVDRLNFLKQQGVIVDEQPQEGFHDVAQVKTSLAQKSVRARGPFTKEIFEKLGFHWFDDIAYQPLDENRYRFIPTAIDSQRGDNGEPLCSLMPMGEQGFLNMASVLRAPTDKLEALRNYLEDDDDKDVNLTELPLSVKRAMLILRDRAGVEIEIAKATAAKNAPYTAMFVTQVNQHQLPLINAAFSGEKNLLFIEYDVDFEFSITVSATLSASVAELKDALLERGLWRDEAEADDVRQLIEELIAAGQIVFTVAGSNKTEPQQALRETLISQLIELLNSVRAEASTSLNNRSNDVDFIELQRSMDVQEPLQTLLKADVADWGVGNVLFE